MLVTDITTSFWDSISPKPIEVLDLTKEINFDFVVIGAGFTGLNAAWHLHKKGASVCILEANTPGWGASGRNGGMAVIRYKHGWSELAKKFGDELTLKLFNYVKLAVDNLEQNVTELGLDCGFKRYGHITAAHSINDFKNLNADIHWLDNNVKDYNSVKILSGEETQEITGTNCYKGAYFDQNSGGINPLAYARTFSQALINKGIPIYSKTPVKKVNSIKSQFELITPKAKLYAKNIVIATNGYSSLFDMPYKIPKRIIPVTSSVIVTESIPDNIYKNILPNNNIVTDTRHLVNYFRRVPGNKILFGGRGSLSGKDKPSTYKRLNDQLIATFPELKPFAIEHRWSGHVAVTVDDFPHINSFAENAHFAMGYGGRGVALTHFMGAMLAEKAIGNEVASLGPLESKLSPIPLHDFRLPVMSLVATYYWLRDQIGK